MSRGKVGSEPGLARRHRHRGRQTRRHFAREGRPREHRQRDAVAEQLARNLVRQLPGALLEAFRRPGDTAPAAEVRGDTGDDLAEGVARHADQQIAVGTGYAREIRLDCQVRRKRGGRQVTAIDARLTDLAQAGGVAPPQRGSAAGAGELHRKRSAPGPCSENRDATGFGIGAHCRERPPWAVRPCRGP